MRDEALVRRLLSSDETDVNAVVGPSKMTALSLASSRGDAPFVRMLLEDPRTECLSDAICPHPSVYGCMIDGGVHVLKVFADCGHLDQTPPGQSQPGSLQVLLLRTAYVNKQQEALSFLRAHFIDHSHLDQLSPLDKATKVRRVCAKFDQAGNGTVPVSVLPSVARALGTPLTDAELAEVASALAASAQSPAYTKTAAAMRTHLPAAANADPTFAAAIGPYADLAIRPLPPGFVRIADILAYWLGGEGDERRLAGNA